MSNLPTIVIVGRVFLVLAAIATSSFPILYAFSPWYKSRLGQMIMMQSVTLATAILLKLILTFMLDEHNRDFLRWLNVCVLVAITISSTWLTYLLWSFRHKARQRGELK